MSALKDVNASAEITSLLACGCDYVHKGTQTLVIRTVYATLDALEEQWRVHRARPHLSEAGWALGLRHYHAVYEASARCVPLSSARWEQWLAGLTLHDSTSTASPCLEESSASRCKQVHNIQADAVASYWHLYRRLCWGSSNAARAGLATLMEQADSAVAELSSTITTKTEHSLVELEDALATPLHGFARLSSESMHLFTEYPLIGRVERMWLSETVASTLGESAEAVVEALVRRTYKRDLRVPSVALPDLLREYEETEINEQKVKDIVAIGQSTLHSSWMKAASALHAYKAQMGEEHRSSDVCGKPGASSPVYNARVTELQDELLGLLTKVPKGQGCLPALGLLVQRLIEDNLDSSLSTQPCAYLNTSQTHFYLHLLHRWFSAYVNSHHRWSVTDMFAASDDADLWMFLLDRHAVCLTWALATELAATLNPTACTHAETQLEYLQGLATKVDKLRAVFYSVVHCLQIYRASVAEFTKPEKSEVRLKTAALATQSWVTQIGVETFCRALLNDLLDAVAQWEELKGGYDARVQQRALLVEVELKLVMYDTITILNCSGRSTERLERLVEDALELCEAWGTTEPTLGTPSESLNSNLTLPIVGIIGRCIHRISFYLRHEVAAVSSVTEAHTGLCRRLVQWLKRGIHATAAIGGDPNALWDEWTYLVSIPLIGSQQLHTNDLASAAPPCPFLGYALSAAPRSRASLDGATAGGLYDICWDRRSIAKTYPKRLTFGVSKGGSGSDQAPNSLDLVRCGEEASVHPALKKGRSE